MAADRGEPRRRTIDPIVAGIGEGVAAGYRAVESVVVGVSESARMRSATRAAGTAASATTRPRARRAQPAGTRARSAGQPRTTPRTMPRTVRDTTPPTIIGELADLTAELLDGIGDAVREIAGHIAERDRFEDDPRHHTLELEGPPGETVRDEFLLSNTGPTALKDLDFEKTNLIGAAATPIRAGAIKLKPEAEGTIDRVRPGGSTTVTVSIKIPADAAPGRYRGVVCARFASDDDRTEAEGGPIGAWALIELEVLATDPGRT
jgi:hypothetical protein